MQATDFNYLIENSKELFEEYRGKWIAVHGQKVIGVGDTATEAAEEARRTVPDVDFILEAVDNEADVIYGGL